MKKKKKPINKGSFNDDIYAKYVSFSKAVLWKDRELSVPKITLIGMNAYNTKEMRFIDSEKGEMWVFDVDEVLSKGKFKQVGQEEQWYFPIDIADKRKIWQKNETQEKY